MGRSASAVWMTLSGLAVALNAPAAPLESNATGCAPGTRCISVMSSGRPSTSGASVAQCRELFPDFIVPKSTVPANHAGP
jgi:hypothetical protein